jgi:NAD/NADP transhydrogenase beta subunit
LLTQHALKERTGERFDKGIDARYAIHPVSGRIPGHTVLLRGANAPGSRSCEANADRLEQVLDKP